MNNVLVVANFSAGRKQAIKYRKKIQKFLLRKQVYFQFVTVEQLNDVNMAIFDTIFVAGGDGTVNKVLPYLVNTGKTLGIIPCGTANLLAEKLGIPTNFKKSLKILEQGFSKKIDVLKINNNFSSLRFGLGYDADIISKTPQSLKQKFGYFAYFMAGILFAFRLKDKEYIITSKNKKQTVNASCIIVANASNMYKNWVSVSKTSELDDGYMEVFVLKTKNSFLFFVEILKMFLKRHKTNKNALYFKTDNLVLENSWFNSHIDGEKRKFKGNVNIELMTVSVSVIVPRFV